MSALLRFDGVTCVRGGRTLFEALDLAVEAGDAIEVAGPNGSGKSSLLRLAAGLLSVTAGSVERPAPPGLIDERLAFDATQKLGAALAFWARIDGVNEARLAAMGIAHLAEVPVRMLSTGQRKRAAFARLIASPARLWLLDEPLNGLDRDGAARVEAAVAKHLESGGALLYASHQPLTLPRAPRRIELDR